MCALQMDGNNFANATYHLKICRDTVYDLTWVAWVVVSACGSWRFDSTSRLTFSSPLDYSGTDIIASPDRNRTCLRLKAPLRADECETLVVSAETSKSMPSMDPHLSNV